MDAVSLALGVIAVFKDGYLVAKFVYNTINSGLKHAEERVEISHELRLQLLFLQSFGSWFVKSKGKVTNDATLNQGWLREMRAILERLNSDLAEYRNLAEKMDEQYQKYSPSLNPSYQTSGLIEFELGEEIPQLNESSLIGNIGKFFSKKTLKEVYIAGEWALFRKRKLTKLVTRFEKRNDTLGRILQIAVPAQIQAMSVSGVVADRWFESDHPDRLGLRGHVQITQIQQAREHDVQGLEMKSSRLICRAPNVSALTPAVLKTTKARNNSTEQDVLVEFKQYEIPGISRTGTDFDQDATDDPKKRRYNQIAKLAALLHSAGFYSLGTLPFKGFVHEPELHRYAFVFDLPEGSNKKLPPQTLHSLIAAHSSAGARPWTLAQRFHCARKIANILEAFNNDGWVHKSIRSHSIALFSDSAGKKMDVKHPYLINFEYSRLHYNTTTLDRDEDSVKDLYRHPALQVSDRQDAFTCVHDIYALGVVLLELVLWKTADQIVKDYFEEGPRNANDLRRLYIKTAEQEVPWLMGDAFLDAIKACLSGQYDNDFVTPNRGLFGKKVIANLSPKALSMED